jgi:hypothetical protein
VSSASVTQHATRFIGENIGDTRQFGRSSRPYNSPSATTPVSPDYGRGDDDDLALTGCGSMAREPMVPHTTNRLRGGNSLAHKPDH